MHPCGSLLVLMRFYRFQWVFVGPYRIPIASLSFLIGVFASLSILFGAYGTQ